MTVELGGFLALAALMVGLFAWLRADARRIEDRLGEEIKGIRQGVDKLDGRVAALEQRMAHLDGLLEGLREAIVAKAA